MIRAIFWKEWREHRWKNAAYWLVLSAPVLLPAIAMALSASARTPFGDLSDSTARKYLAVALLGESGLVSTAFLLVTGFLAVATFSPELEEGTLFFLYEQPLPRWRYFTVKLMTGIFLVVLAIGCAVLLAPAVIFALMLIGGKVTLAGSLNTFTATMAVAARAAVWCSLISLIVFTGSALISTLLPRWWLATAAAAGFVVLFIFAGGGFFDFIQPAFDGTAPGSASIGVNLGTSRWLTVTGAVAIDALAPWRALPMLSALMLTAVFSVAAGLLYTRKELK